MAPPTPILFRSEALTLLPPEGKADCSLHSLVQYNCQFEGGLITCVPFKRVFRDCVLQGGKHRVVELTDTTTNSPELRRPDSECELITFKAAQRVLSIEDV